MDNPETPVTMGTRHRIKTNKTHTHTNTTQKSEKTCTDPTNKTGCESKVFSNGQKFPCLLSL